MCDYVTVLRRMKLPKSLASDPFHKYNNVMNNTGTNVEITTTVSALSDQRLLERIKELSGLEHELEVVVIDHLRELHRRRLYLTLGFSSLFDYAVRELGYSDAAAWRRMKAMRLCADVEGARERLRDGSLTLNAAAQLQNAFDQQERRRGRAGRSAAAGAGPTAPPDGSTAPESAPVRPAEPRPTPGPAMAPIMDASARRALVEQAAGRSTRQVQELLANVAPELAAPAERVRPLGAGRWEIKTVIDDDCRHGLERLKGLLSHVDPHLTTGQIVGRLVREALDRHDPARPPRGRRAVSRAADAAQTSAPKKRAESDAATVPEAERAALPAGAGTSRPTERADADHGAAAAAAKRPASTAAERTSAPKTACDEQRPAPSAEKRPARPAGAAAFTPAKPRAAGRAIPAAVKRQVWERDQGCCSYVERGSGRRCGSRYLLQVDHIFPYALGGSAEPDNLRLLCAAHHRHRHRHAGRAAVRRNE